MTEDGGPAAHPEALRGHEALPLKGLAIRAANTAVLKADKVRLRGTWLTIATTLRAIR